MERIARLIEPSIRAMGYSLVRVQYSGRSRAVLQVMAERMDDGAMDVDDCAELSRAISALLDVEDPIAGSYTLEVSSPGIDRPLVKLDDFDRFAGHEAKIELTATVDGRKRYRGRLIGVAGDLVRLRLAGQPEDDTVELPFADIAKAKLVLTDELIDASLNRRTRMTGAG